MITLENWAVIKDGDWFKAPELITNRLCGEVYGHKDFLDGSFITTSSLVSMDIKNKTAITHSETVYNLGTPKSDYAEYCKKNNIEL